MKAKELRVVCVGIGEMGRVGVQTLLDHGVPIVAAVDTKEELAGRDVAEVSGYPPCGVPIETDLKAAVERTRPNFAFFASDPGWDSFGPDMKLCAERKMNVVTTITDPYYPLPLWKKEFDALDGVFRANGVSLFASGINDVWWSGMGIDIAGTCKRVDSIDFTNLLPLENMGAGVARDFHVDRDPKEYLAEMERKDMSSDESVSGPLMALYVNAQILGLHITNVAIQAVPCLASRDIPMPQWNMTIAQGRMTGSGFDITMTTQEGIPLTTSMVVKVLEEGEAPGTVWTVKGEPSLRVELGDVCGEITTSSSAVNRIPDVIAARPGILTLADLPARPVYRHGVWDEI